MFFDVLFRVIGDLHNGQDLLLVSQGKIQDLQKECPHTEV